MCSDSNCNFNVLFCSWNLFTVFFFFLFECWKSNQKWVQYQFYFQSMINRNKPNQTSEPHMLSMPIITHSDRIKWIGKKCHSILLNLLHCSCWHWFEFHLGEDTMDFFVKTSIAHCTLHLFALPFQIEPMQWRCDKFACMPLNPCVPIRVCVCVYSFSLLDLTVFPFNPCLKLTKIEVWPFIDILPLFMHTNICARECVCVLARGVHSSGFSYFVCLFICTRNRGYSITLFLTITISCRWFYCTFVFFCVTIIHYSHHNIYDGDLSPR